MRAVLDQILQAAVANGVTGVAQPVGPAADDAERGRREAEAEPAHPAAEAAL